VLRNLNSNVKVSRALYRSRHTVWQSLHQQACLLDYKNSTSAPGIMNEQSFAEDLKQPLHSAIVTESSMSQSPTSERHTDSSLAEGSCLTDLRGVVLDATTATSDNACLGTPNQEQ
jgi:hypothetical protein